MTYGSIRVLVVDDSAFARKVIREVLAGAEGLDVVGIARDGLDALEKIAELRPDVITLDLNMPDLDGLGVLRALSSLPHRPAVVVVSMSDEESELGVAALANGAFDVVHKPTALAIDRLYELSDELRAKVVAAGKFARDGIMAPPSPRHARAATASNIVRARVVVVGASTGGPQALTRLIRSLPGDFAVPVAIVLHMPEGYTDAFARRIDKEVDLDVMEARDGIELRAGLVLVARAGMHLTLENDVQGKLVTRLDTLPLHFPHRPSVDVLFRSAAAAVGRRTLGVVLTGMGDDGLNGARAIHEAGGTLLTESASSSVVYGMPRVVFEAGLARAEAPIEDLAALIQEYV